MVLEHVRRSRFDGVVVFSCGNCSNALKQLAPQYNIEPGQVVAVAPGGDLEPGRWLKPAEIRRMFPNHFDATSGHLPLYLVAQLAELYRQGLEDWMDDTPAGFARFNKDEPIDVAAGSGETVLALRLAFPDYRFRGIHNLDAATKFNQYAPLNELVIGGN